MLSRVSSVPRDATGYAPFEIDDEVGRRLADVERLAGALALLALGAEPRVALVQRFALGEGAQAVVQRQRLLATAKPHRHNQNSLG